MLLFDSVLDILGSSVELACRWLLLLDRWQALLKLGEILRGCTQLLGALLSHLPQLVYLGLDLLVLGLQLDDELKVLDGIRIVFHALVDHGEVDEHVDFVNFLFRLPGKLERLREVVKRRGMLFLLSFKHTHIVVGEETLWIKVKGGVVSSLSILQSTLPLLNDPKIVEDADLLGLVDVSGPLLQDL